MLREWNYRDCYHPNMSDFDHTHWNFHAGNTRFTLPLALHPLHLVVFKRSPTSPRVTHSTAQQVEPYQLYIPPFSCLTVGLAYKVDSNYRRH